MQSINRWFWSFTPDWNVTYFLRAENALFEQQINNAAQYYFLSWRSLLNHGIWAGGANACSKSVRPLKLQKCLGGNLWRTNFKSKNPRGKLEIANHEVSLCFPSKCKNDFVITLIKEKRLFVFFLLFSITKQ